MSQSHADLAVIGGTGFYSFLDDVEEHAFGRRKIRLAEHRAAAWVNGKLAREGKGANVLGDPRAALAWIANELSSTGDTLRAGQVVTTGTCMIPVEIAHGDHVVADFGAIGRVETRLA